MENLKIGGTVYELVDGNRIYALQICFVEVVNTNTVYEARLLKEPSTGTVRFSEREIDGMYIFTTYKKACEARKNTKSK